MDKSVVEAGVEVNWQNMVMVRELVGRWLPRQWCRVANDNNKELTEELHATSRKYSMWRQHWGSIDKSNSIKNDIDFHKSLHVASCPLDNESMIDCSVLIECGPLNLIKLQDGHNKRWSLQWEMGEWTNKYNKYLNLQWVSWTQCAWRRQTKIFKCRLCGEEHNRIMDFNRQTSFQSC